jgi:hypothetical protein
MTASETHLLKCLIEEVNLLRRQDDGASVAPLQKQQARADTKDAWKVVDDQMTAEWSAAQPTISSTISVEGQ